MGDGFYNLAIIAEYHHFNRFTIQFIPKRPVAYDYTILPNRTIWV